MVSLRDAPVVLGFEIKRLRLRLGLSQEAFAERADVHRTYVGRVERGEANLTLTSILKLAKALHVSVAGLLEVLD